jgi:hypothetical protein
MVSLAAIRWLADQKAAFVMLNRNGSVLLATGPPGPRDARLRRAQALAHVSGIATVLTRDLVDRKLVGQERNARHVLRDESAATMIALARERVATGVDDQRHTRAGIASGALRNWGAWRSLPVVFPKADLMRVPQHWRSFGARVSPLTGSPRLSVNPAERDAELSVRRARIGGTACRLRARARSRPRGDAHGRTRTRQLGL